ncbi:hypothetical protein [Dactylosporangium sp. NPDC049140]|uniref:hypothetical protein n=1 Tax=Dactylosporangium sp. NPDC049140 TaxID=3155647 RepID=UPI0033DE1007
MDTGSWTWESGCCSRGGDGGTSCRGTTTLSLAGDRLEYRGFCADPGFGGGYWIAEQPVDDFLARGPARPLPEDVVAAVTAARSRTGPT